LLRLRTSGQYRQAQRQHRRPEKLLEDLVQNGDRTVVSCQAFCKYPPTKSDTRIPAAVAHTHNWLLNHRFARVFEPQHGAGRGKGKLRNSMIIKKAAMRSS
jgi:hypothetical protein